MTWSNNIKVDAIGLAAEVVDLRRELEQQATLLGKGSEREAKLMAACVEYRIKLDKLEAENAALRADRDRLDWLEANHTHKDPGYVNVAGGRLFLQMASEYYYPPQHPPTLRAAIDAARKEAQP